MAEITGLEVDQNRIKEFPSIADTPPAGQPAAAGKAGPAGKRIPLAAPVYVRETHASDFPWTIRWNSETCIRCGACVAACTFDALHAQLQRRGQTLSAGRLPRPLEPAEVLLAVRPL